MKRLFTYLAPLVLALAAACHITPEAQWTAEEIPMCSTMRLWEVTRLAMEKNGFPVVVSGFDPKDNSAISGWDRDLHPFKGHGYRERVYIRYKRSENAGKLTLGVRVEQEINDNLAKPLDPEYADWVEAEDNPARAKVVLQYMRAVLGQDLNIGKVIDKNEAREKADE